MGLLDSVFGPKHPPIDASGDAAKAIEANAALASFASDAHDRLEIVPGPDIIFVFIGKPPKEFGIVWFDHETRHDFRSDMKKGLMSREDAARIAGALTGLYLAHQSAARFAHKVGGTRVTVIDAPALHSELLTLFAGAPST